MPTKLPRLNVTVTEEQHELLLELAALQGRSAASYLREMVDAATPLLRAAVPPLRLAAQELELTREQAADALREPLQQLKALGMLGQLDLLDEGSQRPSSTLSAPAPSGSEGGRGKRRGRA